MIRNIASEARSVTIRIAVLVAIACVSGCSRERPPDPRQASSPSTASAAVKVMESTLWLTATTLLLPSYPVESLERGIGGVVVASVLVTDTGEVDSVSILEAPDEAIETEVLNTLESWKFRPIQRRSTPGQNEAMVGKLTFYFVPEGGVVRGSQDILDELNSVSESDSLPN